jgi:hypothetical protein
MGGRSRQQRSYSEAEAMKKRRHRSSIAAFRSFLYGLARFLGDLRAVQTHHVTRRIKRRIAGRITGRWLRRIR